MLSDLIEVVVEIGAESVNSNNKKVQGCGCIFFIILILGGIGFLTYYLMNSSTTSVVVDDKISNNQITYHYLSNINKKGVETLSSDEYDNTKIKDTLTLNLIN